MIRSSRRNSKCRQVPVENWLQSALKNMDCHYRVSLRLSKLSDADWHVAPAYSSSLSVAPGRQFFFIVGSFKSYPNPLHAKALRASSRAR